MGGGVIPAAYGEHAPGRGTLTAVPEDRPAALRRATAALMGLAPLTGELAGRFVSAGHELALVGGPVRDAFLGREPDFSPVDHQGLWEANFPGLENLARLDKARGISLTPAKSGTDGFYFVALQRKV